MIIEHYEQALPPRIPADADVEVHLFYVVVDDIKDCATSLIASVSETSWINDLPDIPRATFSANTNRTIDKLVAIFQGVDSEIKEDFGEYLISMSSGQSLETILGIQSYRYLSFGKRRLQATKVSIFIPRLLGC